MIHRSIYDINTSTQRLHVEHGASFTPHLVTLDFFFFSVMILVLLTGIHCHGHTSKFWSVEKLEA